jgi:predicted Rossmann fold flavoprotein
MIRENKEKYDLIVIGGGASGMMAAGVAASKGFSVLLVEKNPELGKNLKITGGGRCNITNATFDNRELLKNFGKAEQFLYSPFSQFDVKDTFDFFESRGLKLVTEERNRVFPITQKADDVFNILLNFLKENKVEILTNQPVLKINLDADKKRIENIETVDYQLCAKNFVIATGGNSHPETGSTGDGFDWLKNLRHEVKEPTPNVVPLRIKNKWVSKISGNTLSDMKITFYVNNKKSFSEKGRILFTHFGVSGPLVLNSSHKVSDLLHEGTVTAKIDTFPDLDLGSLDKKLIGIFEKNKNKNLGTVLKKITEIDFSKILEELQILDLNKKVHSVSKSERKIIVQQLKNLEIEIECLMGLDKAVISDGGVLLNEIDSKTMRSKIIKNLYLTGDILHINRPSGGYSLQLCWTTGYVAGQQN